MAKRLDIIPADLSIDQIRDIAHRATKEKKEALAKAHDIIARSREAMKRADAIRREMRQGRSPVQGNDDPHARLKDNERDRRT